MKELNFDGLTLEQKFDNSSACEAARVSAIGAIG